MRLIAGVLQSTRLPPLPVLSKVEPPVLRRYVAVDRLLIKIENHEEWPVPKDVFCHRFFFNFIFFLSSCSIS